MIRASKENQENFVVPNRHSEMEHHHVVAKPPHVLPHEPPQAHVLGEESRRMIDAALARVSEQSITVPFDGFTLAVFSARELKDYARVRSIVNILEDKPGVLGLCCRTWKTPRDGNGSQNIEYLAAGYVAVAFDKLNVPVNECPTGEEVISVVSKPIATMLAKHGEYFDGLIAIITYT